MLRNPVLTDEFRNKLHCQVMDGTPDKIIQSIQPIISIDHSFCECIHVSQTVSGNMYIRSQVDKCKEYFAITGYDVLIVKDAACDVASGVEDLEVVTPSGVVKLALWYFTTLTAEVIHEKADFTVPVLAKSNDSGTIALSYFTFAAGNCNRRIIIRGYWL